MLDINGLDSRTTVGDFDAQRPLRAAAERMHPDA